MRNVNNTTIKVIINAIGTKTIAVMTHPMTLEVFKPSGNGVFIWFDNSLGSTLLISSINNDGSFFMRCN